MATVPSFISLSIDSSLRPTLISSPSLSIHRSLSPSFALSSVRSIAGAIASSPSSSSSGRGVFLDEIGLHRLQTLDKYITEGALGTGWLEIRPMEDIDLDPTVQLLAESFVESMGMPRRYVPLLAFLVRQYVVGRRLLLPHAVMLVGFYREGEKEPELACMAEVSFDTLGANAAPPTPVPPMDHPYICNMAVKKEFRRRGIGFRLLMACEELISKMKTKHVVFLHCRVTDTGPLKLYKKAGYNIYKTDSRLVWFSLQRRKHLLAKKLHVAQEAPCFTVVVDNHANH